MKVHCLQHTASETPGSILQWAHQNSAKISVTQTHCGENLPVIDEVDFLIVLGGPQSATQLSLYPYLQAEVDFISKAIAQKKAVLGICLGAQLIGEALGARTEKSPHPEIGVFPLHLLPDAKHDPVFSQFPDKFASAHWHSDMPGLVEGMTLLAGSEGCPRQAFRYSDRVYGLQCHLEMMKCNVEKMVVAFKEELTEGLYIQQAEAFLSADFSEINEKMVRVLDYLKSRIN